jgi:hypothetical protein
MSSFGGATLEKKDIPRLGKQLRAVYDVMADGQFRTLTAIADAVKANTGIVASPQSISARLRDFRKEKFGGFKVNRRAAGEGLFDYQVLNANGTAIGAGPGNAAA